MIASFVLTVLLMIVGYIFAEDILRLINTPDNIIADSLVYLEIYILGLPFVFFYNISTGIFSAMGDSKTPFIFLAVSSVSNIFMDILFVSAFKMGVPGVAWATFICQGVSCILAILFVFRRLGKIPKNDDEKVKLFCTRTLLIVMDVAVPSIFQQSFISIGNIIIQAIVNPFGSGVVAGYSAAVKLNSLVLTSISTISNGISNFTAQNLGAGKIERIKAGHIAGIKLVYSICLPLAILYFFFGSYLTQIFMDEPSRDALYTATIYLKIVSPFYFVIALKLISDGVLRGGGLMKQFMVATFADLFLRVVLSYIFSRFWDSLGIWISWPVGWSIAAVLSIVFYIDALKKKKFKLL